MNRSEIEQLLLPYPDMLTLNEVAAVPRLHPQLDPALARMALCIGARQQDVSRIPRADALRWLCTGSNPAVVAPVPAGQPTDIAATRSLHVTIIRIRFWYSR